MEEYKFKWKEHLQKSFKEFLKDLFFMLCILISVVLVLLSQNNKQLKVIQSLFNEGDWVIITLILLGITMIATVVEKILKVIYALILILLKLIKK